MSKTTAVSRLSIVLLVAVAASAAAAAAANNVQTTRTSLKVARDLDPEATETLAVKTRTGDVATIVVKKRGGRQRPQAGGDENRGDARVPAPVVVRSDPALRVKDDDRDEEKRSRSLVRVDADGVPVITGVREPDDANDTRVWRNARVIDGVLVPNDGGTNGGGTNGGGGTNDRPHAAAKPPPPPPVAPMFNGVWQVYYRKKKPEKGAGENAAAAAYDEEYITDKILGYVKNINDVDGVRSSRTLAEPRMEARVLHAAGASAFPNSAAYTPKSVAPRLQSFEESARTPVLQYAHPELGVQAARYVEPAEQAAHRAADGRRQQALTYFGHDIHADRSPFAFEPGLEKESRVKVPPKKYVVQTPPPYGYGYGGYGYGYGGYGAEKRPGKYAPGYYAQGGGGDDASFWTAVKNRMKSGVDKMSDWTRPVVDPLVEATHKITGNLGLGNRELGNAVKEKLGMVATPSVLLPALGLVAGGAALGLGAVAVGRYLDYDVIRMRNNGDIVEFQRSLNGSYLPIIVQPEPQEQQKNINYEAKETGEPLKRTRRSVYYKNSRPYANRKIRRVKLTLKTS